MGAILGHHGLLLGGGGGGGGSTDPYFSSVVLLLHGNGTNGSTTIIDSSSYAHTMTAHGSAAISTTQSKYGGSSLALLNSGDYVTTPTGSEFAIGTADFCIEGWNCYASGSANQCVFDFRSASTLGYGVYVALSGSSLRLAVSDGATTTIGTGGLFSVNTQQHWAFCRESGTMRLYVGGTQVKTFADARSLASPATPVFIGDNFTAPSQPAKAYADDLRWTIGNCRYPGGTAFTPPAEFPDS